MIRILRGTRLGSEGVLAGRGVSGSGVWEESGIKSSIIGIFLLFWLKEVFNIFNVSSYQNVQDIEHLLGDEPLTP